MPPNAAMYADGSRLCDPIDMDGPAAIDSPPAARRLLSASTRYMISTLGFTEVKNSLSIVLGSSVGAAAFAASLDRK